jgi:hypothetical protein
MAEGPKNSACGNGINRCLLEAGLERVGILEMEIRPAAGESATGASAARRETDREDGKRISGYLQQGLLRGSFVPPKPMRELRELTRRRTHLQGDRNRVINRIGRLLETANIKLGSVVSSQGDPKAVESGIPIAVPAHERHLFADAENFWRNRRIFHMYYVRNDFNTLTQNVPVARALADYSTFKWKNTEFYILPTPGHTPGGHHAPR